MKLRQTEIRALLFGALLLHWGLTAPVANAQTTAAPRVSTPSQAVQQRPGMILVRPSLNQLRPLMGRVVRITLIGGKQLHVRLVAAWPGVVRVSFANGRAAAVARHRIQSVTLLGPRFASLTVQDAGDSGTTLTYLGVGLTLGGVLLGGAVAPPLYVLGNHQECPGVLDCLPAATTAAILVTALSASVLAAGVPLWIVGVVRKKVHGRTGPASLRSRRRFRAWGMGLTVTGTGLAAVGSALLGASAFAGGNHQTELRWAGTVTAPLGVFVALCMGLPMWMEAIRKSPGATTTSAPTPRATQDLHVQRVWNTRHRPTPPATTFAYSWRF